MKLVAVFVALLSARTFAQAIAYDFDQGNGAYSLCGVGDVDGDGYGDCAVGLSYYGSNGGTVVCFSGRDRSILWSTSPTQYGSGLGYRVVELEDLDGDGSRELAVSAPRYDTLASHAGAVFILSGATGAVVREIDGTQADQGFGWNLARAGDVDADGSPDLLIVSASYSHHVDVRAASTGALLFSLAEFHPNDAFGDALACAGDVDSDGHDDVIVGAPQWQAPGSPPSGRVLVVSGATGATLHDLVPPTGTVSFGQNVAAVGDIDLDGFDDFAIAAPSQLVNPGALGDVRIISGLTGLDLARIATPPNAFGLGFGMARVGDADGDGVADLAIAFYAGAGSHVELFSPVDGARLSRSPVHLAEVIKELAPCGDLNADGREDFGLLVWQHFGPPTAQIELTGWPAARTFCVASAATSGCEPTMHVDGGTSLTVGDDPHVWGYPFDNGVAGLLVWNTVPAQQLAFGATTCVALGGSVRTQPRNSGTWAAPCNGYLDYTFRRSYLTAHGLGAGATIYAQFWARDPHAPAGTRLAMSDGALITLAP